MAALGFKLPESTFEDLCRGAPHLLAPTGSNFDKFGSLGTVLAGFHYGRTRQELRFWVIWFAVRAVSWA